ncbi:alpha/beta hydrolase [Micromonospora sp. NPDC023888]|uniref:alpha/beta hydrolase n=1 Tax=Micromonospora sp. NPDC023888 TaxID=3155607 RepID=UPI0034108439
MAGSPVIPRVVCGPPPSATDLSRKEPDVPDPHISSGRVPIAYRDFGGSGPSLVLLHGAGGNLAQQTTLAEELRQAYRVVTLDLRGHGRSGDGPWRWDEVLDDLVAVADGLGLDRPALVGVSLGGMLAALWAQRHPECPGGQPGREPSAEPPGATRRDGPGVGGDGARQAADRLRRDGRDAGRAAHRRTVGRSTGRAAGDGPAVRCRSGGLGGGLRTEPRAVRRRPSPAAPRSGADRAGAAGDGVSRPGPHLPGCPVPPAARPRHRGPTRAGAVSRGLRGLPPGRQGTTRRCGQPAPAGA